MNVSITALEAEYQSLLLPAGTAARNRRYWAPPVLDGDVHIFSWRVAAQDGGFTARKATQESAVLTLTAPGQTPIVCRPDKPADLSVVCGNATVWARGTARYVASLEVAVRVGGAISQATAQGSFLRALERGPDGWGGAEWVGLADPNSTAAQFRSVSNVQKLGFTKSNDVAQATLFVAGLGGHRATVNGRPLDPTSVRGSVTEWSNRTFFFADDVTTDVAFAAGGDGLLAIAIELCVPT